MNRIKLFNILNPAFNGLERGYRITQEGSKLPRQVLMSGLAAATKPSSIAMLSAGAVASAIGPEALGGPGEGETQFDPGRAFTNALRYRMIGGAVTGMSGAMRTVRDSYRGADIGPFKLLGSGLSVAAGGAAAGSMVNDTINGRVPDIRAAHRQATKYTVMGATAEAAPTVPLLWDMLTGYKQ